MGSIWHGLLANFAIVAVTISLWDHLAGLVERYCPPVKPAAMGLLFGGGTVAVMLFPVALQPGVFFDLRSTLLALAAFFGGPVAGLIALSVAVAHRFWIGGAGAPAGIMAMVASGAGGMVCYWLLRRRSHPLEVVAVGALAALGSLVGVIAMPEAMRSAALATMSAPTGLLVFGSTVLAGLALRLENQRRITKGENDIFRTLIDTLPDALNVKDQAGRFVAANPATAALMHVNTPDALIGRTDFDFYPRETAEKFRQEELTVMASGEALMIEQTARFRDGEERWLSTLKVPVRDSEGRVSGLITHNRDITEHRQLELDLEASRRLLDRALAEMADGLAVFDMAGTLLMCNERYRLMFPRTADLRMPGASLRDILQAVAERGEQLGAPQRDAAAWIEGIIWSLRTDSTEEVHLFDGRWLHIRTRPGGDSTSMVVVSDISGLKRAELELLAMTEQLRRQADTDGLTGLLNRRAFDRTLSAELARNRRHARPISLLMIDIDHFKSYNDLYGHPMGDECLRRVASVLVAALKRPADIAARYGGEEFVAVLPDTDTMAARQVAKQFLAALRAAGIVHEGSKRGVVTASIGIAECGGGESCLPDALVAHADMALYRAKEGGRDRVECSIVPLTDDEGAGQRRA